MAIKGSLKEASLADVCQLLALGQKSGVLSVTDRSSFGQIFFDRGRITFAKIVNRRDRLGDYLIRDGVIQPEQLQDALAEQARTPDRRLGEILMARGWIEQDQLQRYVQEKIEEAVYLLFTWTKGSFYFEVDQKPEPGEILVDINPESLLLEAARRVDEWSLIEKKIPSLDLIFEVDTARLREAEVSLTPEQERVLPLLDGTRTVQEVADQSGLTEFDVGQAIYGLIQAGFAHRVGQREWTEGQRVREADIAERRNLGIAFYRTGMYEEAVREFRRVLEMRPDDAAASFYLALIALRERREREAVRRLKLLMEEVGPRYAAFVNLAIAFDRLGRSEDALVALNEAEAQRPATPVVALLRAAIQLRMGDVDAATESLAEYQLRLRTAEPPAAPYYHYAALVAALAGRLDMAEATIRDGLDTYPSSAPLLLLAGAIAERRGDYAQAESLYRHAAEEDAELPQAHKNLGDLAYRRGMYEDAVAHYRRAQELAPELGDDLYAKLGNIFYRQRNRTEAVRCWERALELNPQNEVVKNNLAVVAHAAG